MFHQNQSKLALIDEAMKIEANTLVSVFFSFQRLENYVLWDQHIARRIIEKMYARTLEAETRFPAVVAPYEDNDQSEEAMHLEWVCAQVPELALDLELEITELEKANYRSEHPVISAFYDALVCWFNIPVHHF